MGTDGLSLFNRAMADLIHSLPTNELIDLFADKLPQLREHPTPFPPMVIRTIDAYEGTPRQWLEQHIRNDVERQEFVTRFALEFVLGREEIHLDYWGCWAEVFEEEEPDGIVDTRQYLGTEPDYEEDAILLPIAGVESILNSLRAHQEELSVMNTHDIERIESWRVLCLTDPSYMIAYRHDFG
jgi:hypothetical protein